MSCNLHIIIYTPQKLSFLWHIFLAFIVIPRNACLLLPCWHPFKSFVYFCLPLILTFSVLQFRILFWQLQKKHSAVNWNFKWILKILLSLVCLLELCQESSAFMLHKYSHRVSKESTFHWRDSQFSETDSWGIGYKYLVHEKVYALHGTKEEGIMILKNTH
jgi:hypothetical protein